MTSVEGGLRFHSSLGACDLQGLPWGQLVDPGAPADPPYCHVGRGPCHLPCTLLSKVSTLPPDTG